MSQTAGRAADAEYTHLFDVSLIVPTSRPIPMPHIGSFGESGFQERVGVMLGKQGHGIQQGPRLTVGSRGLDLKVAAMHPPEPQDADAGMLGAKHRLHRRDYLPLQQLRFVRPALCVQRDR